MNCPAFIIVGLFASNILFSQIIKSLEVDFIRSYHEGERHDKTSGHIYYQADNKFLIHVTEPIHQWMIAQTGKLIIYYPDDKKVFHFPTDTPFNFPFFQAFLGVVAEDYGLTNLGFALKEHKVIADTLFTTWSPPEGIRKDIGNYLMTTYRKKIIRAELQNPDESIQAQTFYSKHIEFSNINFPLEIITLRYENTAVNAESILYSNPIFNKSIPDSIATFSYPDDVDIEEIIW